MPTAVFQALGHAEQHFALQCGLGEIGIFKNPPAGVCLEGDQDGTVSVLSKDLVIRASESTSMHFYLSWKLLITCADHGVVTSLRTESSTIAIFPSSHRRR